MTKADIFGYYQILEERLEENQDKIDKTNQRNFAKSTKMTYEELQTVLKKSKQNPKKIESVESNGTNLAFKILGSLMKNQFENKPQKIKLIDIDRPLRISLANNIKRSF